MKKKEQGILTVEASIVLTLFLLFVLFLFSFARMYRAQNMISHATMQSADALALESYIREVAHDEDASEIIKLGNQLSGLTSLSEESFTSLRAADIPKLAKEKFAVAISSSEANADAILKKLGVKGGLSGVDFSVSKMDLDSNDVIVYANYTLELQFPVFGFSEINVTKAARAKTFGDILFEICTISNDDNMGTASGGGSYKHGTTIEITAEPKYGYCFEGWDDDGDGDVDYDGGKATKASKRTVTVTDAKTYTAIFKNNGYGVNASIYVDGVEDTKGLGTITMVPMPDPETGKHSFNQKVDVTVALPENLKNHYDWLGWIGQLRQDKDGDGVEETILSISDPKNNLKYTIPQVKGNYLLKANFSPKEYTVTVKTDGGGSVEIIGHASNKKTVTYPGSVTIKAKPNDGYVLDYWLKNGVKLEGCNGKNELPNISVNETVEYKAVFKNVKVNVYFYGADDKTVIATIPAIIGSTFDKQNLDVPTAIVDSEYILSSWKGFSGNTTIDGERRVYGNWNKIGITINKGSTEVNSSKLTATTYPSGVKITWSSSNSKVLSVDSNGNITAKGYSSRVGKQIYYNDDGSVNRTTNLFSSSDKYITITAKFVFNNVEYVDTIKVKTKPSVDVGYVYNRITSAKNGQPQYTRHYFKNMSQFNAQVNSYSYEDRSWMFDRSWNITYSEWSKATEIPIYTGKYTSYKNTYMEYFTTSQFGLNYTTSKDDVAKVVVYPNNSKHKVLAYVQKIHAPKDPSDLSKGYYDYYISEYKD